jgi:uncharacterized protein
MFALTVSANLLKGRALPLAGPALFAQSKQGDSVMSGLLALLDDVAAIAKVAASSVDDITSAAAQASAKAAGVVIDDAAVAPKYVTGFAANRELPMIGRIALGSIRNKLLLLLPVLMLLESFLPQAITPLLMLGGCYLCFEGAEKVFHKLFPHGAAQDEADLAPADAGQLEEAKVAGAIKTDFILSAEIMTISLAAIPQNTWWMEALTLALVGVIITVVVYGAVALIVKMDDIGLHLARTARTGLGRGAGRGLVRAMPWLLSVLASVGTLAMLWVGGSILLHGAEVLGYAAPAHWIHEVALAVGEKVPEALRGLIVWLVTAIIDGVFGLLLGLVLIPLATWIVAPLVGLLRPKRA